MIRFPKMHIAESVVNRIMNAAQDIGRRPSRGRGDAPRADPELIHEGDSPALELAPDPTLLGGQIDLTLAEPVPEVAPNEDVVKGAALGESPLESLMEPQA